MEDEFKMYKSFIINDLYARITDGWTGGQCMFIVSTSPDTAYFYSGIAFKTGIPVNKWSVFLKDICFVFDSGLYFFNSLKDASHFARCLIALTSDLPEHRPLANQIKDNYERSVLGIESTDKR